MHQMIDAVSGKRNVSDFEANILHKSPLFLTLLLGYTLRYDKNNFFRNKLRAIKKEEIPEFTFVGRQKEWRSSEIVKDYLEQLTH